MNQDGFNDRCLRQTLHLGKL